MGTEEQSLLDEKTYKEGGPLKPYKLVRSKRKTLALTINSEARLIVRAPLRMPEKDILAFIEKKSQWIERKQKQVKDAADRHKPLELDDGESILYLGEQHLVLRKDVPAIVPAIIVEKSRILLPKDMTLEGFVQWMKSQAEALIRDRASYYGTLMGVEYTAVKMSNAKKRWGSCSAQNSLNFAWRLVMCPPWVIDYVVIHELAHISYKDHGPKFWALVATQAPHYKEARAWLRTNHKLVDVI